VTAQQGAYATSVLALLVTASLASFLDVRHRKMILGAGALLALPFLVITVLFALMGLLTVVQNFSAWPSPCCSWRRSSDSIRLALAPEHRAALPGVPVHPTRRPRTAGRNCASSTSR